MESSEQFVNARSVLLSAVTVINPLTTIDASKDSQRLDLILSVTNLAELFCLNKSLICVLYV